MRERERETDRQTENQTDRLVEIQRDKKRRSAGEAGKEYIAAG